MVVVKDSTQRHPSATAATAGHQVTSPDGTWAFPLSPTSKHLSVRIAYSGAPGRTVWSWGEDLSVRRDRVPSRLCRVRRRAHNECSHGRRLPDVYAEYWRQRYCLHLPERHSCRRKCQRRWRRADGRLHDIWRRLLWMQRWLDEGPTRPVCSVRLHAPAGQYERREGVR